jgi:rod shape-determining protein MreC
MPPEREAERNRKLDRKFGRIIALGILLLVALKFPASWSDGIKSGAKEAVAPLHGLVSSAGLRIRNMGRSLRGWGGLPEENRKLSAEVVQLQSRITELEALEMENMYLRDALEFKRRASRNLVACEVIARDISGWWRTIRINKGGREGVQPDQAVVTSRGLVGKVISVSPRTAEVLLVSDPGCRVSVEISGLKAYGVLSGKGLSARGHILCEISMIQKGLDIPKGAAVVTSGLGGIFPRGLMVGYIEHVEMDEGGLFQRAEILPQVDLGRLDYVFVVLGTPPETETANPASAGVAP